jgi:hypothetical protein
VRRDALPLRLQPPSLPLHQPPRARPCTGRAHRGKVQTWPGRARRGQKQASAAHPLVPFPLLHCTFAGFRQIHSQTLLNRRKHRFLFEAPSRELAPQRSSIVRSPCPSFQLFSKRNAILEEYLRGQKWRTIPKHFLTPHQVSADRTGDPLPRRGD